MSDEFMAVSYHWPALGAAWLLAVYAIYLLTQVIRRIRASSDREVGSGWWIGGALCIGTGVWAESFLGLVGMELPIKLGYVPAVVLASWLPAVGISAVCIWLFCLSGASLSRRVLGGIIFAGGLSLMVGVNVSSIVVQPAVVWDPSLVVAGVALTLVGCAAASFLIRRDLALAPSVWRALVVSLVVGTLLRLGQAVLVMAVSVPSAAICLSADLLSGESMEWMLSAPVMLLCILVHMGTVLDSRTRSKQDQLVESLKQAQTDLQAAANRDVQTGLLNRLGFESHLKQLLEGHTQSVERATVLRLSLDGFRAFVETYGHALGDNLVRHMASRLKGLVRDRDVLARVDSDEFILLCLGLGDTHAVAQLAQRLSESIKEPCLIDEVDISLTCSIGIAQYPESTNGEQVLSHSMDALQTARKAGGAVYCFYERGMDRRGAEQVEMQRDLRHAIERHELMLHFQPKLHADGGLAGVEALLRWTHPQRGSVSPAQFIPVAERFGLIGELGLWVLQEACRYVRAWQDVGLEIPVAVNISAHQLRQPDLEQRVREALITHNVPARMLILEITESAAMDDIDASIRVFDMLADIGVQLSIDDFGTGYSSLSYLRRLPAKQLKIDRAFVRDLDTSQDAQAIVEAVVRLAHALGLKVVAEGVETQAQADILTRFACDELQGFLFAKPMPAPALPAWLAQRKNGSPSGNQSQQQEASAPAVA